MFISSTTKCDGSFVKISSIDAKKMAEDALARVKKRREDSKERAIQCEMEMINNGFFHKLFRMKPATREEAIAELEADHWNFDYHFTNCIGYQSEEAGARILNACKYASELYISTEDLRCIS